MAVSKVTRSNPSVQPQAQSHQRKAEFLETLHHLNRGYGVAISALERLETKDRQLRPSIFPGGCLRDYRNQTEALRAVANRDLLRILAGHEDHDAERFGRLLGPKKRHHS